MSTVIVTDKHFREWEQDAFGYGYGTGEAHILPVLWSFMAHLEHGHAYSAEVMEEVLGSTVAWLLINVLCRTHILDYGTSPRYGWLRVQGERLRDYMLNQTPEALYVIATQDFDYDEPLCSRWWCNCADAVEGEGCRHNPLFNETVPTMVG